jgi:ankyrin repeat protein
MESSESCTLHLVGGMGCGKGVLTKHVLKNDTKRKLPSPGYDDQILVLSYFCTRVNRPVESATLLLESLVYQLLVRHPLLFRSILQQTEIFDSRLLSGHSAVWSLSSLWKILTEALNASQHSTVYFFIDALDECSHESTQKFLSLYNQSHKSNLFSTKKIKFFISSQQRPHIIDGLHTVSKLHHLAITLADVAEDIQVVLSLNLDIIKEQFDLEVDETLELQHRLAKKSDGMFQWATIALNEIRNADDCTLDSLMDLIKSLPPKLGDLYHRAFRRVLDSLPKKDLDLLRKILIWLLLASRPLTVSELTLALAISPNDTAVPPRRRRHLGIGRFISKPLAPFVEIVCSHQSPKLHCPNPLACLKDPQAIIRPVHQSAQDFLFTQCIENGDVRDPILSFNAKEGHEYIARTCLTYLRSKELQLDWIGSKIPDQFGLLPIDHNCRLQLDTCMKDNELLRYCAQSWTYHLRGSKAGSNAELFDLVLDFIINHQRASDSCYQVSQHMAGPDMNWHWPPGPLLNASVRTRSRVLVELFLNRGGIDVNRINSTGTTALMEVCGSNHPADSHPEPEQIFFLLLEYGADPAVVDKFKRTAVHWAADSGMLKPLKMLLGLGLDTSTHDVEGFNPLHLAIYSYKPEAASLIASSGTDLDIRDKLGASPLHCAVATGQIKIVESLLLVGADLNAQDERDNTPLVLAIGKNNVDIALLLLSREARIDIADIHHGIPIHGAAARGQLEVLQALLDLGAPVDAVTNELNTALHFAAENGRSGCCDLLLQRGANVEVADKFDQTPLALAILGGDINTVQCLLKHGANPNF